MAFHLEWHVFCCVPSTLPKHSITSTPKYAEKSRGVAISAVVETSFLTSCLFLYTAAKVMTDMTQSYMYFINPQLKNSRV
jgi:hypothetical protein